MKEPTKMILFAFALLAVLVIAFGFSRSPKATAGAGITARTPTYTSKTPLTRSTNQYHKGI